MFKNLETNQYKWRFVEEEMSQTKFSEITKSQVTWGEASTQFPLEDIQLILSREERGVDLC